MATSGDYLRGFLWLLDEGALERSTRHDAESDYAVRSVRFTKWLREAYDAAQSDGPVSSEDALRYALDAAARDLVIAERERERIALRLGLIARVSAKHASHACPEDDCLECWPGDLIEELRRFAEANQSVDGS